MPCGKKPLRKSWDKHRNLRVITPSRYEQNEASVKAHWRKVTRDLELSYKDDQFWESQSETVRTLVGPAIFQRIAKIFSLPTDAKQYEPQEDLTSPVPSELFYQTKSKPEMSLGEEEQVEEEESENWSVSSKVESLDRKKSSKFKSADRMKSMSAAKSLSKSLSQFMSKTTMRSYSSKRSFRSDEFSTEESAYTDDDLQVYAYSVKPKKHTPYRRLAKNPHFEMLYCNESETDMIKWKSKYKVKGFEISASDEFSKKAEIMTKMISKEFYDWWVGLGNVEFKSEIKRPEDIEDLFQVWFNEHASRGLVLHPKIIPCVLRSIADFVGVPKAACPNALKRQIAYDIHAETSPAHYTAFGTSLPHKMKHFPPLNNTEQMWHCVKIPEDLRSMACVWEDVQHLTSTKAFHEWLQQRPHLPMPKCLKTLGDTGDKKQLFVVPSDYVLRDRSITSSAPDLALPVSQFSLELKEVLSKLMNQ